MTMGYQPFLIANPRVGMERDLEPWLLPEDAFPDLEDCYLWRGRIKKKMGYNLLGRLNLQIATVLALSNTVSFNILPFPPTAIIPGTISFKIGTVVFVDNGAGGFIQTDGTVTSTINYVTGAVTLNLTVAVVAPTPVYYFPSLPVMGLPTLETLLLNQEKLVGFDTSYAYLFDDATQMFINFSNYKSAALNTLFNWTGANFNFFWTNNYFRAFWATNSVKGFQGFQITAINNNITATITFTGPDAFLVGDVIAVTNVSAVNPQVINGFSGTVLAHAVGSVTVTIDTATTPLGYTSGGFLHSLTRTQFGDGIRWHDQEVTAGTGWVNFMPPVTSVDFLMGCLILVSYKGCLIALNTTEGNGTLPTNSTNYQQRARWNLPNATPFYNNYFPVGFPSAGLVPSELANIWRSDIPGNGGFIDAPTSEAIVSAEFVKDTLVVYFEFSTWQLRFTGFKIQPFIWEKINTELGSVSTFSVVPFDKMTMAVGNVGIHACDSVDVQRIDQKIPNEVFQIQNKNAGNKRVYGIRDYYRQLVYWAIPYLSSEFGPNEVSPNLLVFPNKILVYNYVDGSFSFFNDTFTCFGFYQSTVDRIWKPNPTPWSSANYPWVSPQSQSEFPSVVGGNQQGFVEILMRQVTNDDAYYMTNATIGAGFIEITSPNHTLGVGTFIFVSNCSGITNFSGGIYKITKVVDANKFQVDTTEVIPVPGGAFTGNGTFSVISNISILTKRFNPWIQEGAQVRLGYIDFYFDRTATGAVSVDLFLNEDDSLPTNEKVCFTFPESTYTVSADTSPYDEKKLWKRVYFEDVSQLFQIEITLSDALMKSPFVAVSDITLHGMICYFSKSGRVINV